MRWLVTFLFAAAAIYLGLENVRLRRDVDMQAAALTAAAPAADARRAGAHAADAPANPECPPCTSASASSATLGRDLRAPSGQPLSTGTAASASLQAQAQELLRSSRKTASDHLAAFADEASLRPEQLERARQVARDISDMVASQVHSLDPAKAGASLSDLSDLLREAEDRFVAMLDPKQVDLYQRSSFDFAREALLLDDRAESPITRLLNQLPAGQALPRPERPRQR